MTGFFDSLASRPHRRAGGAKARRFARSGFPESTLQEVAWQRTRGAGLRWAIVGAVVGAVSGLVVFAPAAWLARAVASATDERVLLTDARGTLWNGNAVAVLSGGDESRSASALPGRLTWTLQPGWMALKLALQHDCCINGTAHVRVEPGLGRMALTLLPPPAAAGANTIGQVPAAWLTGLGTPWNTLQPGGLLSLRSPGGLTFERVQGRARLTGEATVDATGMSSRISTLPTLGSYRLQVRGDAANGGGASVNLSTLQGPLQMTGQGQWAPTGLRFRGEATAGDGQEDGLSNLLNIIGRRRGPVSALSIG